MTEFFTLQFIAPLLAGMFALVMGVFVLRTDRRNVTYQYYFLIMAAVAIWSLFVAIFHVPGATHDTWTMLHWVAGIFITPAYFLFLVQFPSPEHVVKPFLRALVWTGPLAMSAVVLIWPQNFVQYYIVDVHEIPHLAVGPYAWLLELYFPAYFIPGFFFAGRKFLKTYGRARAHMLTGLLGLAVGTTGALITNVTLAIRFGKEFIWLGPIFSMIASASLAYMLFGIREGKPRLFPSLALGGIVLLALTYLTITSDAIEEFIFNGMILVGAILLSIFLVRTSLLEAADVRRFQDLSARLQRYNEELKKADRVKSEFLAIVSHHLRTPLTHIKWALSGLSKGEYGGKLAPEQQKLATELLANNERLVGFVESLMDTSRIEAGQIVLHKEHVDIEKLLRGVIESFSDQAKHYYHVEIEMIPSTEKIPLLSLDQEAMRRALKNIIENALIYNKAGGKIFVAVRAEENKVVIEVSDTGIGIPSADLQRVGEKFFRSPLATDQAAEGTGLGVFIASHIVKLHGGNLEVQSQEGKGTTVTITLPAGK